MDFAGLVEDISGYYFHSIVLARIILLLNPMVMDPINFSLCHYTDPLGNRARRTRWQYSF